MEIVIDLFYLTEISSQMARLAIDEYLFRLWFGIEKAVRFSLLTHVWVTVSLWVTTRLVLEQGMANLLNELIFLGKAGDNSMMISNLILSQMLYDHLLFYELSKSMISRELWVTLR